MNRIDQLVENYRSHIHLPLRTGLPPSQRTWFAFYPAFEERRLINRIDDFELATKDAGYPWHLIDLKKSLSKWLDTFDPEERETCFQYPDDVELYAKKQWKEAIADFFREEIKKAPDPTRTVFALTGLMDLYDYLHVSELMESLQSIFPGYLLVFFPGEREGNTYRFLDARVGWDYLGVPILSEK